MTHPKYDPPKGSLAYRIIEYMKTLPPGKQIASGPLAEAMGQPSSAVITALLKPEAHGLVVKERVDGFYRWRLGDGVPLNPDAERDPLPPRQIITRASPGKPEPLDKPKVAAPGKPKPAPAPEPLPEPVKRPAAPAAAPQAPFQGVDMDAVARPKEPEPVKTENRPLRFGWWNDGEVTMIKGDSTITLTPDESRKLLLFLSAIDFAAKQAGEELLT